MSSETAPSRTTRYTREQNLAFAAGLKLWGDVANGDVELDTADTVVRVTEIAAEYGITLQQVHQGMEDALPYARGYAELTRKDPER